MKKSKFRVRISDMVDQDIVVSQADSSNHQTAVHRLHMQSKKWQRRDDRLTKSRLCEENSEKKLRLAWS